MIIFTVFLLIALNVQANFAAQASTAQFGNIQLTAYENDWEFGKNAVHIIQEYLPQISRSLGNDKRVVVHVVIAHTEHDFKQMTGGNIPDWGIAAAEPQSGFIFLKSPRISRGDNNFQTIVVHELSHVVLGNVTGGKPVPRWFDEGLALYNSGELGAGSAALLSRTILSGHVLGLNEIDDVLQFRQQKAALAYQESLSAIEYLTEKYGSGVIARLTSALSDGKSMEHGIMEITGVSIGTFEEAWMEYIRKKYLWMAVFDIRFIMSIVFVGLFLIAWARKRHQAEQQKRIWEKEENYETADQ